jgi:hypothetical protein
MFANLIRDDIFLGFVVINLLSIQPCVNRQPNCGKPDVVGFAFYSDLNNSLEAGKRSIC